jgi:hypothetical protein
MIRLYAPSAMPARLSSHDGAKLFEHGFILLQCRGHLIRGDPPIGIQTFGLQFQLFAGILFKGPVGNPGQHLGVSGTQAGKTFGAETGVAVGDVAGSFQLPATRYHRIWLASGLRLPAACVRRLRFFRDVWPFCELRGRFVRRREHINIRTRFTAWRLRADSRMLGAVSWQLVAGGRQLVTDSRGLAFFVASFASILAPPLLLKRRLF